MSHSVQSQLKQLEKDLGIEWQNIRLGDIFEFESIKQAKSQRDIPIDNSIAGIPYVVQSMFNNMVSRTVNKQWLIENNEPPVSGNRIVLGVTLPAVSYQPIEFGASQVITARAEWLNSRNGIFITTSIAKLMYQFSYGRKPGMQIYKDMEIKLPSVIKSGKPEIAFDYIDKFIATLNDDRIATLNDERITTLNAYLSTTGLKDCSLTKVEQAALEGLNNITWGSFNIEDVLVWQKNISEINPLDLNSMTVSDKKSFPFYGQATTNNGIIEFRHLKDSVLNNKSSKPTLLIHSNNQNIVYLDTPFYLKDGHGATSVLQSENLNKFTAQFLISSIKKVILQKYTYNSKATKIELKNTEINLPVNSDNLPDWDYMFKVISAMQKVVIKNVIDDLDDRIKKTKIAIEADRHES